MSNGVVLDDDDSTYGALGAVSPLTPDVQLLGDLLDGYLFLGGGDRGHALNLLPPAPPPKPTGGPGGGRCG